MKIGPFFQNLKGTHRQYDDLIDVFFLF